MATPGVTLPADIAQADFDDLLARYPMLIEAISESKPVKDGQQTLRQLDRFRYVDALDTFGRKVPQRPMDLEDVKRLVEWKLRHGKFRPTLMSLVSSNNPESTKETIQSALEIYRGNADVPSAIAALSKLKGIGPATASLLLTVHDPKKVIFFSDEAFYWLCCGGKKSPIKYNAKEYQSLLLAANEMIQRLDVSATDIEKVAYVIMKGTVNSVGPKAQKAAPVASDKAEASGQASQAAKRRLRSVSDAAQVSAPARRSKRSKT